MAGRGDEGTVIDYSRSHTLEDWWERRWGGYNSRQSFSPNPEIMFLDELSPVAQQLITQPVAFLGGLASGLLRLNLTQEPVKSWLEQQGAPVVAPSSPNHNGSGPKSITID